MLSRILPLWMAALLLVAPPVAAEDRPNVVWLVSEDNAWTFLRLFDASGAETPHIEALAAHGIAFERAFSNAPVCSVARTILATGVHAPRLATQFHRRAAPVRLPEGVRPFPALLREAGYYAANDHKKDYNFVEPDDTWDDSSPGASWRGREPGQPFFYMRSFGITHEGQLHFDREEMREQATLTPPGSVALWPQHPHTPAFRYTYARYHDLHRRLDQQIGEVVAQLAADGLLEQTFVFYFGDHGGVLPGSKGYAREVGLHVPLVVRVPERYRQLLDADLGSRVGGLVSFVDMAPTVLRLAGVRVPAAMDGEPFLGPGVSTAEVEERAEVFGYADRFDEKYDMVRVLRRGRFEYVRRYQPFNVDALHNAYRYRMLAYREWRNLHARGALDPLQRRFFEPGAPEALYDVEADPFETTDLSRDPAYADVLGSMRERLREWAAELPDLSFFPEPVLVERAVAEPFAFGRSEAERIARLRDVADLQLRPFDEARSKLEVALRSPDPWARYWALVTCSAFGSPARHFAARATELAAGDPEPLVRARAAELLALVAGADPTPALQAALRESTSRTETLLILNSAALLHEVRPGYALSGLQVRDGFAGDAWIRHRLERLRE